MLQKHATSNSQLYDSLPTPYSASHKVPILPLHLNLQLLDVQDMSVLYECWPSPGSSILCSLKARSWLVWVGRTDLVHPDRFTGLNKSKAATSWSISESAVFEATLYNFPLVVSNRNSTLKLKHLHPILSKQSSWNDCYYELLVRQLCMAKPFFPPKKIACILACTCPSLVALQLTRPHHSAESLGWHVQLSIKRHGWSCNEQNASKCCWIWL